MRILKAVKNDSVIIEHVEDASSFFRRFMGLMYRRKLEQDSALLLTPCNEIHTFAMRFAIDVVTLSRDGRVLFIDRAVGPHKIRKKVKNGYMVLELNADAAERLGIEIDDIITFEE